MNAMKQRVLLDLFCGRWGASKGFLKRGWKCIGVDLSKPPEIPEGCEWHGWNILELAWHEISGMGIDFIWASSPCEEFSVHGMKHFHPNPKYPENGIKLFNHTRQLCEASGVPYVMENVRAAQQFVGNAVHHCGPFYLWGNAVPPLMPQGIIKGFDLRYSWDSQARKIKRVLKGGRQFSSKSQKRKDWTAQAATIPPELAACVADYVERLLEARR